MAVSYEIEIRPSGYANCEIDDQRTSSLTLHFNTINNTKRITKIEIVCEYCKRMMYSEGVPRNTYKSIGPFNLDQWKVEGHPGPFKIICYCDNYVPPTEYKNYLWLVGDWQGISEYHIYPQNVQVAGSGEKTRHTLGVLFKDGYEYNGFEILGARYISPSSGEEVWLKKLTVIRTWEKNNIRYFECEITHPNEPWWEEVSGNRDCEQRVRVLTRVKNFVITTRSTKTHLGTTSPVRVEIRPHQNVTIRATPTNDNIFVEWQDGSQEATRSIEATEYEMEFVAKFKHPPYRIMVNGQNEVFKESNGNISMTSE